MLSVKIKKFIENFSYAISSQFISMFISAIVVLVVPKLIGVEEYGYWQLYLFYAYYVGLLHFGWNDGIYLRYGGILYKEINKKLFFSQFWMLTIFQIIIGLIILVVTSFIAIDEKKIFILYMIILCMLIINIRLMPIYILQATNRIREFAHITMTEKLLYCFLLLLFLFGGIRDFKVLIIADLIGKIISFAYAIYCVRDIVFNKISIFAFSFKETTENINVGIKLMFSNLASLLIIGIIRIGIEYSWNIKVFGKISLILSIANLLIALITAIGIILFPILRRLEKTELPNIFILIRDILMTFLLGILIIYFPVKEILIKWLPHYADTLIYLAILFPICVGEGKMALLTSTYLKTLRREKTLLKINVYLVLLSIIFTIFTTLIYKNLTLAVLSIFILIVLRSLVAEIILFRILNISLYKDISLELLVTIIFIIISWFIESTVIGLFLYIFLYGIYIIIKAKSMKRSLINLKKYIKAL